MVCFVSYLFPIAKITRRCSHYFSVRWYIMKTLGYISESQLNRFRALFGAFPNGETWPMVDIFRPIQSMDDRVVYECGENGMVSSRGHSDEDGDQQVSPPIYTIPRPADAVGTVGSGVQMNMIFMVSIAAIVIIAVVIGVCTGVCISSHLQCKQVAPIPAVVYDKVHDEDLLVDDFDL